MTTCHNRTFTEYATVTASIFVEIEIHVIVRKYSPDGSQNEHSWFQDRHKQEISDIFADILKERVQSETGSTSAGRKTPHKTVSGSLLRVAFWFTKRTLPKQTILLNIGGCTKSFESFCEKLVVYVYHLHGYRILAQQSKTHAMPEASNEVEATSGYFPGGMSRKASSERTKLKNILQKSGPKLSCISKKKKMKSRSRNKITNGFNALKCDTHENSLPLEDIVNLDVDEDRMADPMSAEVNHYPDCLLAADAEAEQSDTKKKKKNSCKDSGRGCAKRRKKNKHDSIAVGGSDQIEVKDGSGDEGDSNSSSKCSPVAENAKVGATDFSQSGDSDDLPTIKKRPRAVQNDHSKDAAFGATCSDKRKDYCEPQRNSRLQRKCIRNEMLSVHANQTKNVQRFVSDSILNASYGSVTENSQMSNLKQLSSYDNSDVDRPSSDGRRDARDKSRTPQKLTNAGSRRKYHSRWRHLEQLFDSDSELDTAVEKLDEDKLVTSSAATDSTLKNEDTVKRDTSHLRRRNRLKRMSVETVDNFFAQNRRKVLPIRDNSVVHDCKTTSSKGVAEISAENIFDDCIIKEELCQPAAVVSKDEAKLAAVKATKCVADLSDDLLRHVVNRNTTYLSEIFKEKRYCRRHEDYKKGGKARVDLTYQVRLSLYTEQQHDVIMAALVAAFCKRHQKYLDYLLKVLLPEVLIKIYMDVHGTTHSETERVMEQVTVSDSQIDW